MSKSGTLDEKLSSTEELDFHYLLTLMPSLYNIPNYSWLPELFATVGHESLIKLCKYAGGETITIPTLEELSNSVEAMQWYYDVYVKGTKSKDDVPSKYADLVSRIAGTFNA